MRTLTLATPLLASLLLAACQATGTATVAPAPVAQATPANGVASVSVSRESLVLGSNRTEQLRATVKYADGSQDAAVTWSTSDATVVGVDETGKVQTQTGPGVASLRATSTRDPAIFAIVPVTVKADVEEAFTVDVAPATATVATGGTVRLKVSASYGDDPPSGAWSSSDEKVAKVDATGVVTGVGPGKATITFTPDLDVRAADTAEVTVTAK